MDFFVEILKKPFSQLLLEQRIAAVLIMLLGAFLVLFSILWLVRRIKARRRDWRHPLLSPVDVAWDEGPGVKRQGRGRCLDVSAGGLKMELNDPIKVGTLVFFHVLNTKLVGRASVRYCTSDGPKYVVGVEFTDVER